MVGHLRPGELPLHLPNELAEHGGEILGALAGVVVVGLGDPQQRRLGEQPVPGDRQPHDPVLDVLQPRVLGPLMPRLDGVVQGVAAEGEPQALRGDAGVEGELAQRRRDAEPMVAVRQRDLTGLVRRGPGAVDLAVAKVDVHVGALVALDDAVGQHGKSALPGQQPDVVGGVERHAAKLVLGLTAAEPGVELADLEAEPLAVVPQQLVGGLVDLGPHQDLLDLGRGLAGGPGGDLVPHLALGEGEGAAEAAGAVLERAQAVVHGRGRVL
jgi:hypothetical protein